MRAFFHVLINPLVVLCILLLLCLGSYFLSQRKLTFIFSFASLFWFFVITISPVPQWLAYNLEKQYSTFDRGLFSVDGCVNILVLGGGYSSAAALPASGQLGDVTLSRLVEAVRIYRLLPDSRIITSGAPAIGGSIQAETVALAALEIGVNAVDTLMMNAPSNTEEEASEYVLRFRDINQLILVTSAIHMPRAMTYFRHLGINPIAAPSYHFVKVEPGKSIYDFRPSVYKIAMLQSVFHEYAGFLMLWWGADEN